MLLLPLLRFGCLPPARLPAQPSPMNGAVPPRKKKKKKKKTELNLPKWALPLLNHEAGGNKIAKAPRQPLLQRHEAVAEAAVIATNGYHMTRYRGPISFSVLLYARACVLYLFRFFIFFTFSVSTFHLRTLF